MNRVFGATDLEFVETTTLHDILRQSDCDIKEVKRILNSGLNINQRNINLDTPLHIAVKYQNNRPDIILELLKRGADPSAANDMRHTPLIGLMEHMWRSFDMNLDVLKELVMFGSDVHHRSIGCFSAFQLAVERVDELIDVDCIKTLIKFSVFKRYAIDYPNHIFMNQLKQCCIQNDLACYTSDCENEVVAMKLHRMDQNLSLYDFVLNNPPEVRCRGASPNYTHQLHAILSKNSFPIYSDLIASKIERDD